LRSVVICCLVLIIFILLIIGNSPPNCTTPSAGKYILEDFSGQPPTEGVFSKMCTKADFSSPWILNSSLIQTKLNILLHHRKFWELTYIVHVIEQLQLCKTGNRGLVFAAGKETLISFFASHGCSIMATDMPPDLPNAADWIKTNQHASNLEGLFYPIENFSEQDFLKLVSFQYLDMNFLPSYKDLDGKFDFLWSTCSIEHVGSITLGQRVVLNAMDLLKPGGVAIHTVEFTLNSLEETLETGATVLWRKQDIEKMVSDLERLGYKVFPVYYGAGGSVVDQTPDIPPYGKYEHLKLMIGKYICTSFAFVIQKPSEKFKS